MAMNTLVHFEKNGKKISSRDKLLLHLKDYYPKPSVKIWCHQCIYHVKSLAIKDGNISRRWKEFLTRDLKI